MKTPLSPTQLIENGQLCFAIQGCMEVKDPSDSNMQLQQEKKKLLYSLCEVCNIQLHSAAQAQVHYNGKSHLKRVKQLNNGELPTASASSTSTPLHSLSSSGSGSQGLWWCWHVLLVRMAAPAPAPDHTGGRWAEEA